MMRNSPILDKFLRKFINFKQRDMSDKWDSASLPSTVDTTTDLKHAVAQFLDDIDNVEVAIFDDVDNDHVNQDLVDE
jgi:hypothetical protein